MLELELEKLRGVSSVDVRDGILTLVLERGVCIEVPLDELEGLLKRFGMEAKIENKSLIVRSERKIDPSLISRIIWSFEKRSCITNRKMEFVSWDLPLLGQVSFGLIDRGTNLIQVRPITGCNLNCIYCGVDAGPFSRSLRRDFFVDCDYIITEFEKIVKLKGERDIEAHIDGLGEPLLYPWIRELVQGLSDIEGVEVVSMQTNATLLDEDLVDELIECGMSRFNVSLDSLDKEKASLLSGTKEYPLEKVIEICKYIASSEKEVDLLIAPVWLPGINDSDILDLVDFSLEIGAGKRWPPIGIQKYISYRRGRKPKVREMTFYQFYRKLREIELSKGVKLVLSPRDFGIHKRKRVKPPFKRGEKVKVEIVSDGVRVGERIGVARGWSLVVSSRSGMGSRERVLITKVKGSIVFAEGR